MWRHTPSLLLLFATTVTAGPECPCVSVSHVLPQTDAGCLAKQCDSPLELADDDVCVPVSYGSTICDTWDQDIPECQASSPPAHCNQPWCYVDPIVCRTASTGYRRSVYFPDVDGLFFSYATCGGDLTKFEAFELMSETASQSTISVVLPSATYLPYHFKQDASGDPVSGDLVDPAYRDDEDPWCGILVEYVGLMSAHSYAGLAMPNFDLTWVSVASRAEHSSSWTAAVADVAHGIADVGLSLFWITAERLEMSSFTANLATDLFYLFVPKPRVDNSLMTQVKKPFEPFEWPVWLLLLVVILSTGTLFQVLTTRLWWPTWSEKVGFKAASKGYKVALLLSKLSEGWYSAFMGVVTGGPELDGEHRLATRLLNAGLGVFILIFLTMYTANLAAFLTQPEVGSFWSDLQQATDAGAKICAHIGAQTTLTRLYPKALFHFRYMDVASDLRGGAHG